MNNPLKYLSPCASLLFVLPSYLCAADHVVFTQNGQRYEVSGKPLVEAQDGGLLLKANDGQIWTIQPDEIHDRKQDDAPVQVLSPQEAVADLVERLGADFKVHQTAHYIVVSNADDAFVEYCSSLFEKLYKGFYAFWKNNRWDLPQPEYPAGWPNGVR
ncbi:MAG: hypothetical protein R3C05_16150 [Pirellulaceae bacterium]